MVVPAKSRAISYTGSTHQPSGDASSPLQSFDPPFDLSLPMALATPTATAYQPTFSQGAPLPLLAKSAQASPIRSLPAKPKRPRNDSSAKSSSLRFFVVDHPTKLKDKAQMRENRKHVMLDYLTKERLRPDSTDARVTRPSISRKRKHQRDRSTTSSVDDPSPTALSRNGSCTTASNGGASPNQSKRGRDTGIASLTPDQHPSRAVVAPRRKFTFVNDLPLVQGIPGGPSNSTFLKTSAFDLPTPSTLLGSDLNPFDTSGSFSDQRINTEELKWNCSRHFGSAGLAQHWVPELLKARHAFLSTLCISTSHEDIMRRGQQAAHERLAAGSYDRWKVRGEVLELINSAMNDPTTRTTDATIIAVLNLLHSEIMGCDGAMMKLHQIGLLGLVQERGGLGHLGVDGRLASILTITMFMISTLRESEPDLDFLRHADQIKTKPPNDLSRIPESPVYCRPSGFYTILRSVQQDSPAFKLLSTLRLLTNSFLRGSRTPLSPIDTNAPSTTSTMETLHNRIISAHSAYERPGDFALPVDIHIFETLRLTAQVYSHALFHGIPFSKAASQLADSTSGGEPTTSWHILIKNALIKTDLSYCWGHMAGVLLWVTLVAGACGNPDSPHNELSRALSQENEEARKWLSAIAVRCSIILSFEHGGPMLGTLKRLVGIERALASADAERTSREKKQQQQQQQQACVSVSPSSSFDGRPRSRGFIGPVELSFAQRTFSDFAEEFNLASSGGS